jgi:hypothetical protein
MDKVQKHNICTTFLFWTVVKTSGARLKKFLFLLLASLRLYTTVPTEQIGLAATLSTCIVEVFVSNNYRDTGYIEGFLVIPRSLLANDCIAPKIAKTVSFQFFSN